MAWHQVLGLAADFSRISPLESVPGFKNRVFTVEDQSERNFEGLAGKVEAIVLCGMSIA